MSKLVSAMSNVARNEKGALAYKSTQSQLLDVFGSITNFRKATEQEIYKTIDKMTGEDVELAIKLLFQRKPKGFVIPT